MVLAMIAAAFVLGFYFGVLVMSLSVAAGKGVSHD